MKKIKGKPVSSGIAFGKAFLYNSQREIVLREKISPAKIDIEIDRFNNAVKKTRSQLKKIYNNLEKIMAKDSALIIETQILLLKEGNLIDDIKNIILADSVNTEWAARQVEKKYTDFFNSIPDLSFREKRNDISDVLNRLIGNLKKSQDNIDSSMENVILVADDILPSMTAQLMSKGNLLGLVLNEGGETSHSVILARTMEIPTILDTKKATELITNDDFLVVDGSKGEIFINPGETLLSKYTIKRDNYRAYKEKLKAVIKLPDITRDGHGFHLSANIELPFESDIAHSYGAKGIGLYRTEFLFTDPSIALSTEQQYLIYKNIAQKAFPHPVVIRTFDIGRDKNYNHFAPVKEANPALGTMAVRLFLREKKLFKTQIKAILMANESGNIRILFPMVTEIEEVWAIKEIVHQVESELKREKKLPKKEVPMGIMIEIPGTVKLIKHLEDEIDFFSVGTNDLVQYLLAVDRNNSAVSYLFTPFHPAVIEILMEIERETASIGKEVSVCGEIAGKGITALMLLGMGYRNFSMNPISIVGIKRIFTNIHYAYIKEVVDRLPQMCSKGEIEAFLQENIMKEYPHLLAEHQAEGTKIAGS